MHNQYFNGAILAEWEGDTVRTVECTDDDGNEKNNVILAQWLIWISRKRHLRIVLIPIDCHCHTEDNQMITTKAWAICEME